MRGLPLILLLGALSFSSAFASENDRPKMLVVNFTVAGGADPAVARVFSELVTEEVGRRGYFQVMSMSEIATLAGVERQKSLMGCGEDTNCMVDIAGGLGAQFILSGSVSRFGDLHQLSLQTMNAVNAKPVGRATRVAPTVELLRAQVRHAVAEATGTPLPTPAARVAAYVLVTGGGALAVGGGLLGVNALNDDAALSRELAIADNGGALRSADVYSAETAAISRQKTVSLIGIVAGLACATVGTYLLVRSDGDTTVALVPSTSGAALVGVFP